jgi:hypothetical protein
VAGLSHDCLSQRRPAGRQCTPRLELRSEGPRGGERRADALAAYDRLPRALAGELGIDPSAALQVPQTRILRSDQGREARGWHDRPDGLREF